MMSIELSREAALMQQLLMLLQAVELLQSESTNNLGQCANCTPCPEKGSHTFLCMTKVILRKTVKLVSPDVRF